MNTHKTGDDSTQEANHSGAVGASDDDEEKREKVKWPKANELSSCSRLEEAVLKKVKKGKKGGFTTEQALQRLADGIYSTGVEEL